MALMTEPSTPELPTRCDFCECEVERISERIVACPKCHAIWFIGTHGTLQKREPHQIQRDGHATDN